MKNIAEMPITTLNVCVAIKVGHISGHLLPKYPKFTSKYWFSTCGRILIGFVHQNILMNGSTNGLVEDSNI